MKVAIKVQKLPHKKSPSLCILQIMLLQDVQIFLSDCRLKTVEIWDIWQLNNEKTKVSQQIVRVPKEQMGRRNVQDKQQFCPCFLQKRVCIAIYLFAILDIVA